MMNDQPEDNLTYADLVEQQEGGSSESQRSRAGRELDDGDALSPPDNALTADDPSTTAEGQRRGSTLEERLGEEIPDQLEGDRPGSGQIVEPGGEQAPDEEASSVAMSEPFEGSPSAEEDAMRIEDERARRLGLTDHEDEDS
jgi:hypothetical protein